MEYIIRNKWITLRGSSYVRDINENDLYKVQGKFWTFTRKKFLRTLDDKDIYVIRNKFWKLFHYRAFVLEPDQKTIAATVTKKIFSFHDRYLITSKYGELEAKGNILGFNYHISMNGKEIAHIARKISLRDSFVLDIDDGLDSEFFIALVIAIDNITDERNQDAASSSSYYSSSN